MLSNIFYQAVSSIKKIEEENKMTKNADDYQYAYLYLSIFFPFGHPFQYELSSTWN